MNRNLHQDIEKRMEVIEESVKEQIESLCYTLGELHFIQYLGFLAKEQENPMLSQADTHTAQ